MNRGIYDLTRADTSLVSVHDFVIGMKDVQLTPTNSYMWSVPANARGIRIFAIGGGGGGGSGRRGASGSARFGGGGGSSAGMLDIFISAADIGTNRLVLVNVGLGGVGGAAQASNDSNGNNGTTGNNTTIIINGKTFVASQGVGGSGGTATAGTGGGAQVAQLVGGAGGISSATATPSFVNITANYQTAAGGGGGGGISTGDTSYAGGQTRLYAPHFGPSNLNTGGTVGGGAGDAGISSATAFGAPLPGGSGAGGGAGTVNTVGGAGGDGAEFGGGGGGGGASYNGFASGRGGNGAAGLCRITVFY